MKKQEALEKIIESYCDNYKQAVNDYERTNTDVAYLDFLQSFLKREGEDKINHYWNRYLEMRADIMPNLRGELHSIERLKLSQEQHNGNKYI